MAAPTNAIIVQVPLDGLMIRGNQNISLNASCTTRGSPAEVIFPKFAVPNVKPRAPGLPKKGVLVKLKRLLWWFF